MYDKILIDIIREPYVFSCKKHDLYPFPDDYADNKINLMTNVELIWSISDALEKMNAK